MALAKMIPPHLGTISQSNRNNYREIASITQFKIQSREAFWDFRPPEVENMASAGSTQPRLPPACLLMMALSWWKTTRTLMTLI